MTRQTNLLKRTRLPEHQTAETQLEDNERMVIKREIADLQLILAEKYLSLQQHRQKHNGAKYNTSINITPMQKVYVEQLVDLGWYQSLSDFVRCAVRNELLSHNLESATGQDFDALIITKLPKGED